MSNLTTTTKALIIYDSFFGNTEQIAREIARAFSDSNQAHCVKIQSVSLSDIKSVDILVAGAPTRGGQPSPDIKSFIEKTPKNGLKNIKFAAFDTRARAEDYGFGVRVLMHIIKYAAGKIDKALASKGGISLATPEGFYVKDKEGPLKEGELERAYNWGKEILRKANTADLK
jgi:flavodoxin